MSQLLTLGATLTGALTVTSKNPVVAVLFLIFTFLQAALYLLVKGIGFVGMTYIIVYVGAITVLFLFVVMMVHVRFAEVLETGPRYTKNVPIALFILLAIASLSLWTVRWNDVNRLWLFKPHESAGMNDLFHRVGAGWESVLSSGSQIGSVGEAMYTQGAFWFLLLGALLLLAMIAPLFLSKE